MDKTVVIAGASGFIGRYFIRRFAADGWTVRTIGRHRGDTAPWGEEAALVQVITGSNLLVNLAGRTVNCRYSARNRRQIIDSRVRTTAELGRAVSKSSAPPAVWLNASTGTIYRHAEDRPQAESGGELGVGFSVEVAKAWEAELMSAKTPKTRKIPLRITIVLGPGGGVMRPLSMLVRTGLGGHMGKGTQKFSWVHVADLYRAVQHIYATPGIDGPVNIASPQVVDNRELMRLVRAAYGAWAGLPSPAWLLKIGAVVIRTETELVLKSRWVESRRLVESSFTFDYQSLAETLADIAASDATGRKSTR